MKILLCFINTLVMLLAPVMDILAQGNISVQHFPYIEQLPSNTVKRIFQDSDGYIWFGTFDGLCRYDGYKVTTFRSSTNNPNLLTDNDINQIAEDKNNQLWIGTNNGINILNKKNYQIHRLNDESTINKHIKYIKVSSDGYIWVGVNNYLLCFNPDHTLKKKYDRQLLSEGAINSVFEDSDGNIWVTAWNHGLFRLDKDSDTFIKYPSLGANNNPFRIFQDNKQQFWICTWGGGLFLFYPDKPKEEMYIPIDIYNKDSKIKEQTFFSITQDDKNGYIWVVSFSGLHTLEYTDQGKWKEVDISQHFSDFNNIYSEIVKDRNGNLWVGAYSEGIININFDKPDIKNIDLSSIKHSTGITPNVTSIYKDNEGLIWFNQNRWGLGVYNPETRKIKLSSELGQEYLKDFIFASDFKTLPGEIWFSPLDKNLIYSLIKANGSIKIKHKIDLADIHPDSGNVVKFHEDKSGNIWIITTAGIFVKPHNEDIKPLIFSLGSITDITEDKVGNVWISTLNNGIYKFSVSDIFNTSKIKHHSTENSNLKSNKITSICIASDNKLWIGAKEGFIISYDETTNEFIDISSTFKVIEEGIQNIVKDSLEHIWISTNKRLVEYNPSNETIRDYSKADGISVNSFLKDSYHLDKAGNLFYGGNGGITEFSSSESTDQEPRHNNVLITDVKVNHQSLLMGNNKHKLNLIVNDLAFRPDDKNIEIQFSSLNFSFPAKIRYAYKLEGVDNEWIYTEPNRQFAIYNQLPKGKYTFFVKATDENGQWSNSITSLNVYKRPAIYETWYAYTLYFILLVLLSYFAYRIVKNRIKLRNDLKIAQIEKEKSEELTQTKLRYFTNISHDFLTPLTIVSCLVDDIETTIKGKLNQFDLMRLNINRLRRLLQQVLDFRKMESGNMKLKISEGEIVHYIKDVCYVHFSPLMSRKNIDLEFSSNKDSISGYFDADKIDKIVFNLLSNSYKYTPEGGHIEVNLTESEEKGHVYLLIEIKDTGIGIPKEELDNIFIRFYNNKIIDPSKTNGIGLSLTKDLVELHKGSIKVESKINIGTSFKINIPIDKASYSDIEITNLDEIYIHEKIVDIMSLDQESAHTKNDSQQPDTTILLVEDNVDLLKLMTNIMSKHFHVETAHNGLEALSFVKEKDIDIIISDVMMPEMDGINFCKTLKNDIETSHIPLILLTAKSGIDDRIECYNAGADGYISKPFDLRLLEARINSFLMKKKQKQKDFRANFEVNISTLEYPSIDENFLKDVVSIIEKHLSEPMFDVVFLAKELNISKSSLYRKIKTLTDSSPGDFIRNIRLKNACAMLKDKAITISEVAYLSGFSDPKYFSTCFKNEFKMTPSEYQKQN